MKRILWIITTVGALAVPAGIAAAQTDDDVTETETPTTVVCDQDQARDQLRLQDGTGGQKRTQQRLQAPGCDDCDQAQAQAQAQVRNQARVEDGQGEMVRNQARVEDCDTCTGDQARTHARVEDGTGNPQRQETRQSQQQDREPGMGNQAGQGRGGR